MLYSMTRPKSIKIAIGFLFVYLLYKVVTLIFALVTYFNNKSYYILNDISVDIMSIIIGQSLIIIFLFILFFKIRNGCSWARKAHAIFLFLGLFLILSIPEYIKKEDYFALIDFFVFTIFNVTIFYYLFKPDSTTWLSYISSNYITPKEIALYNKKKNNVSNQQKTQMDRTNDDEDKTKTLQNEQRELTEKLKELQEKVSQKELQEKLEKENIDLKNQINELENRLRS